MTVIYLALAILANYRVARMVAMEDGPADVFSKLGEWNGGGKTWIGRGLACPLCVGFWIALPISLIVVPLLPIPYTFPTVLLLWLGIAGAQTIIQRLVG